MSELTTTSNSCRKVESTLWLTHSDQYSYINAYNLAYLSRLAYSRVVLDDNPKHEPNFREFIYRAKQSHTICNMDGDWRYYKLTKIKDDGEDNITQGLTPFIQLVDIGKGIKHPNIGTGSIENKSTSTTALYYTDETRVIISVRGTYEIWKDGILIDADAKQVKSQFGIKGELHRGFYIQAKSIIQSEEFINLITDCLQGKDLYITGHSLGGAVATILSAYLSEQGFKPLLYTYGSPRVGNAEFAQYYAKKFVHFRHVNAGDWVPAMPGRIVDGGIYSFLGESIRTGLYLLGNTDISPMTEGLINFEGDVYTHHGNLCQFMNEGNNILQVVFKNLCHLDKLVKQQGMTQ